VNNKGRHFGKLVHNQMKIKKSEDDHISNRVRNECKWRTKKNVHK